MKKTKLLLAISLLGLLGGVYPAAALGTAFTYQGRLVDAGSPASGNYDLRFSVWDSAVGGLQVGGSVVVAPVSVSSGLFTVPLDFGGGIFAGPDRWLQIESRVFGGPAYSLITPRQKLTPTPYATYADTAGSVVAAAGTVSDVSLSPNVALLNRNPQAFAGTNTFAGLGLGTTTPGARLQITTGTGAGYYSDAIIGPGGYFSGEEHSINFDDSGGHIGSLIVGWDGANGYFSVGNLYNGSGAAHTTGTTAFRVFGSGNVSVDPANLNNGLLNNGNTNSSGLTFGTGSGEGIASKRTAGGNQYGLDFYTDFTNRMSIANSGYVGIGRQSPITGADIFDVRSPAASGYGGMYMDTAGATALPFYGYALNGSAIAWTYLDGSDGNKWKVFNGGDQLTVTPAGNVGIGTTSPSAKLHVAGTAGTDGIKFPDGSLQLVAPKPVFSNGYGQDPWNTNRFLAPSVIVTVTSSSQLVLITSNKALGSIPGAQLMNLYIGYRASGSVAAPFTVGGGIFGNKVAANTRVIMGMSGVITGLAPGNYEVGLVGISTDYANWNSNEWGYTTATVY